MKKTLSLILAVVMLLGCMSMTAFAETEPNYFCITNISEEAATVTWKQTGTPDALNLHYSFDKSTWTKIETLTTDGATATISLPAGQSVYFKNDTGKFSKYFNSLYYVCCDKAFAVSGDITTLLNGTGNVTDLTSAGEYVFAYLFAENRDNRQNLTSAENLILPSTTLTKYCYCYMFGYCSLTIAPELPATTLAEACYLRMFTNCEALTIAPKLPAETLVKECYDHMFSDCVALNIAPELPATTLAEACYKGMFFRCTSLTVAPELPAETLVKQCYAHMFDSCEALTIAPELPAKTLAEACYSDMFAYCKSLTIAPELPAETLVRECYAYMFKCCNHLSELHVSFTKWGSTVRSDADYSATCGMFEMDMSSATSTLHLYCPAALDTTKDDNYGLNRRIKNNKVIFHNTDNYTVIRGNITAYDVAYEMIIPTATSLDEDSHENVLLGKDGIVSVNITKHPSDKVKIYYYADLENGTLTDGTNTIDTSYAYKQGDGDFAKLEDWDTEVTVYTGGEVVPSYVSVTADDEQWNDAPAGTYTASISFNFYCKPVED